MLVAAALIVTVFIALFRLFKNLISRGLLRRKEEGRKAGGLGVFNRITGAFTLAIKGFVFAAIITLFILTNIDFSGFEPLKNSMFDVYDSAGWITIKPHIFDFVVVGVIFLCIRCGFTSGISSSIWSLMVLALIVGAGFMSYHLAFNVEAFNSPAQALGGSLEGPLSGAQNYLDMIGLTPEVVARILILIGLFIIFAIVIFLISKFVPKVLHFARQGSAFYVIDGILGAFVALIIVLGILLFLGSILEPLHGLEFMATFDAYFEQSFVANYLYTNNILLSLGMTPVLPLRDWLAPNA